MKHTSYEIQSITRNVMKTNRQKIQRRENEDQIRHDHNYFNTKIRSIHLENNPLQYNHHHVKRYLIYSIPAQKTRIFVSSSNKQKSATVTYGKCSRNTHHSNTPDREITIEGLEADGKPKSSHSPQKHTILTKRKNSSS